MSNPTNDTKTIMTVDDSASMRQMVSFTLKQAGYSTVEAQNGKDALMQLRMKPVNMFIVDLNMPEMDGLTLIRHLRANATYRFTPIIMLTTESEMEKKLQARAAGATGWIVKPFKPEQLIAVVKKVLR